MNSFKVNESSFSHYWISKLSMRMDAGSPWPKDFCSYWRHALLWSPMLFIALIFVSTWAWFLIIAAILNPVDAVLAITTIISIFTTMIGLIYMLYHYGDDYVAPPAMWIWNHGPSQVLSFIFITVIGTAFSFTFIKLYEFISWLGSFIPKRKVTTKLVHKVKEPSMMTMRYKSWKEKYCPMVEYVSDDAENA